MQMDQSAGYCQSPSCWSVKSEAEVRIAIKEYGEVSGGLGMCMCVYMCLCVCVNMHVSVCVPECVCVSMCRQGQEQSFPPGRAEEHPHYVIQVQSTNKSSSHRRNVSSTMGLFSMQP